MSSQPQNENRLSPERIRAIMLGESPKDAEEKKLFEEELQRFKASVLAHSAAKRESDAAAETEACAEKSAPTRDLSHLRTDHLDSASYREACRLIDREIEERRLTAEDSDYLSLQERKQALFNGRIRAFRDAIDRFTGPLDTDVAAAIKHIEALRERIERDRNAICNFYTIADGFAKKTSLSLSDFEAQLTCVTEAFRDGTRFLMINGSPVSDSELSRAYFICSAQDIREGKRFRALKNAFAYLSHYAEILEKERIYQELIATCPLESRELYQKKGSYCLDGDTVRPVSIVGGILTALSLMVTRGGIELEWEVAGPIALAVAALTVGVPLGAIVLKNKLSREAYEKAQREFSARYAVDSESMLAEEPAADHVDYVVAAGVAGHKILSSLGDFLNDCIRDARITYGIDKNALRLYSRYFGTTRSVSRAKEMYEKRTAEEKRDRERRAAEERLEKRIVDAVVRTNAERNAILAAAALDLKKTNEKLVKLEKERTDALKRALDE